MVKKTNKSNRKNGLLLITLIVFIFSIVKIGKANASNESFSLTDVEITSKTDTTNVESNTHDGKKIENNIVFHKIILHYNY